MQRDLQGAEHVEYSIKLEQCWKLHQGSKALLRTCPNEKNKLDSYLRSHEVDKPYHLSFVQIQKQPETYKMILNP